MKIRVLSWNRTAAANHGKDGRPWEFAWETRIVTNFRQLPEIASPSQLFQLRILATPERQMINMASLHSSEPNDLPELLTRPLADNAELRLFVSADLKDRLAEAQPGPDDDTAEQAAARLAALPASPGKRRHGLLVATMTITLLWLTALAVELPGFLLSIGLLGGPSGRLLGDRTVAHANSLIMPGSPFDFTWESDGYWSISSYRAVREHPEVPSYYYLHCRSQMPTKTGDGLPADYDATWRRLDPDNAVWPLLKASRSLWRAIDPKSRDSRKGLVVADPAMFAKGIASFEEAARLPRLTSFQGALQQRLRESLTPPTNVPEANAMRYLRSLTYGLQLPLAPILEMEAKRLAAAGDTAALADFLRAWRTLQLRNLDPDNDRFHQVPALPARQMAEIAGAAGLAGEQSRFMALYELLRLPPLPDPPESPPAVEKWFRGLQSLDGMERATLIISGRCFLLALSGLVLAAGWLLWLRRAPFGGAADRYSECLQSLFPQGEALRRVFVPAVLPPLFLLAMLLPLLPAVERNGKYPVEAAMEFCAVTLALALLSLVLIGYREMARRTACIGLVSGKRRVTSVPFMILAALLIQSAIFSLYGQILSDGWMAPFTGLLASVFAVPFFAAAINGFARGLFSRAHAVRHRLLARLLQPAFVGLAALMLLAIPFLHLAERRQVATSFADEPAGFFARQNPAFAPGVRKLYHDWGISESSGKTNDR